MTPDSIEDARIFLEHEQFERAFGPGHGATAHRRLSGVWRALHQIDKFDGEGQAPADWQNWRRPVDTALWGTGFELRQDGKWWTGPLPRSSPWNQSWTDVPRVTFYETLAIDLIEHMFDAPEISLSRRPESDITRGASAAQARWWAEIKLIDGTRAGSFASTAALALCEAYVAMLLKMLDR